MWTEAEAQLVEDHLRFRDNESQARYRQANLFAQNRPAELPGKVFAQTVIGLTRKGVELETARWAAGTATIRLPNGTTEQTIAAAICVLRERDAA